MGIEDKIKPILSREDIFANDLYAIGLAETVTDYFKELIEGPGAVRETLKRALN